MCQPRVPTASDLDRMIGWHCRAIGHGGRVSDNFHRQVLSKLFKQQAALAREQREK